MRTLLACASLIFVCLVFGYEGRADLPKVAQAAYWIGACGQGPSKIDVLAQRSELPKLASLPMALLAFVLVESRPSDPPMLAPQKLRPVIVVRVFLIKSGLSPPEFLS